MLGDTDYYKGYRHMKLSPAEVACVEEIRKIALAAAASAAGPGNLSSPRTRSEKRRRKLCELVFLILVGCGNPLGTGFYHGIGLIPADMYDASKHTKLDFLQRG